MMIRAYLIKPYITATTPIIEPSKNIVRKEEMKVDSPGYL